MKRAVAIMAVATLLLIAGNLSRDYRAFGGEEMGFIALTAWAIAEIQSWRKEKKC